jgi:hypothetical protein
MPIRGSPNGANHLRPQAGRDRLEQVVAINRNAWSQSIGTTGRNHPVRALPPMLVRNRNHCGRSARLAISKNLWAAISMTCLVLFRFAVQRLGARGRPALVRHWAMRAGIVALLVSPRAADMAVVI